MEWKMSQSNDGVKPEEIDRTSSAAVVYIRKDLKKIIVNDENGGELTRWEYMEQKIPREDWALYEEMMNNRNDVTDIQLALCDLYELVSGGK